MSGWFDLSSDDQGLIYSRVETKDGVTQVLYYVTVCSMIYLLFIHSFLLLWKSVMTLLGPFVFVGP